jgi:hypothetical protein
MSQEIKDESPLDTSTSTITSLLPDQPNEDEEFGKVPWQYHWKRLSLAHIQSNLDQVDCNLLADKVPIQTVSARLNEEEIKSIIAPALPPLDYQEQHHVHPQEEDSYHEKHMPWEDLESSVEDEHEDGIERDIQEGYVVSITLFVSKSFLQDVQDCNLNPNDIIAPADTILIEVIKDMYWKKDSSDDVSIGEMDGTNNRNDSVEVVKSRVLYWPKALTNNMHYGQTKRKYSNMNPIQSIQHMIHNMTSMIERRNENRKQEYNHRRRKIKGRKLQQLDGVTGITLVRTQPTKYDKIGAVDVDEIVDLLTQLNLGIDTQVDAETLATILQQDGRLQYNVKTGEDGDLLLSCICNDGNIQLFSVLDLLDEWNQNLNNEKQIKSVLDVISGNDKENEAFSSRFESFIIGNDLVSSLQKSVLPLSKPIATIPLTVSFIKDERLSQQESKVLRNKSKESHLERLKDISSIYDDHQPNLDLSTIDSTLEPSTLCDKTMNNVMNLTCAAFGYIAVAGKGSRRIRRYDHLDRSLKTKNRSELHAVPGGFVTLISTTYHSESRTIFLPFEPLLIGPIYWKNVQFLIVCGKSTHECIGIRLDSSSYVSFQRKSDEEQMKTGIRRFRKQQEQHYIRKFVPIHINLHDGTDIPFNRFIPLGISNAFCDPPSIIICSSSDEKLQIRNITFDSYNTQKPITFPQTQGTISTRWDHRNFVEIDLYKQFESDVCQIDFTNQIMSNNVWCMSGQGWSLICFHIKSEYKLFSVVWDGSSEKCGAFYIELVNMNRSNENQLRILPNAKLHGLLEQCPLSYVVPDFQVCVGFIRDDNPYFNMQLSLRSNVCRSVVSSSFEEIIEWLCSRDDYHTAACIALSLLDDKEGMFDVHGDNSNACELGESPFEGILDGITVPTRNTDTFMKLSNITISCLVNGGPVMTHTLDNFLGRNKYYDASVACQILVDCTVNTIADLSASDMSHLAPYSYNPLASQGHALWPIQCLLRVAVSKNCMETALEMLNKNIPDILRHRCLKLSADTDTNSYRSCLSLSKSIIGMILAASNDSASYLMQIVEEGTSKCFWDSLDDETRTSLSLLSVQGKYPLLREVEVREWVLDSLHKATGLLERSYHQAINEFPPSEFLRGICSGVTCNSGCDFSKSIFITTELTQDDFHDSTQEKEDDLFEYISTNSLGSGGMDYDLLIPSLLLLKKRETYWFTNQIIPLQSILNVVCDLAGRPSVGEERFTTNLSALMKQCVLMENPLAAANLIGGLNGMILKCVNTLVVEAGITILEAENYLLGSEPNDENQLALNGLTENRVDDFNLTEGHKLLLSLFEKHVLAVRKFGEFAQKNTRGHVNPVIAARMCFKSWFYLARKFPESGPWIEKWLSERLNLDIETKTSKLRLPSAALIRALLWDEVSIDIKEEAHPSQMGLSLGFSKSFLISLARSSCGLLESVPPSVAKKPVGED